MIDKTKYQTLEYTACYLDRNVWEIDRIRMNPDLQFPKKTIIDEKIYFDADEVKRQKEQRIEEVNY